MVLFDHLDVTREQTGIHMKPASITNLRITEQDRQSTYNVTLRHIHVAIVAVEKQ